MKKNMLVSFLFIFTQLLLFGNNKISVPITGTIYVGKLSPESSLSLSQVKNNKIDFSTVENNSINFSQEIIYTLSDNKGNSIPEECISYKVIQGEDLNSSSPVLHNLSQENSHTLDTNISYEDSNIIINLKKNLPNNQYAFDGNLYIKFKDSLD